MNTTHPVYKYINRIRNEKKRLYATEYLAWYNQVSLDNETMPSWRKLGLTYMGAQAVRMRVHQLIHAQ